MFDNLKGLGSLAGIMKDLPKLQAAMEDAKARLADITVEADTAGGAVRVIADGQLRIRSITIEPAMLVGLVDANDPADKQMAEDLITGAVNAALIKAREAAAEEMATVTQELGLPIPPGGIEGLLSS